MRRVAIAALLALGACAGGETMPVWYRSDGAPVGAAEMHSALLACGSQMSVPAAAQQMPVTVARGGTGLHDYEQLQGSPAFNRLSAPEIDACLRSYGYRADLSTGSGSSVPPSQQ